MLIYNAKYKLFAFAVIGVSVLTIVCKKEEPSQLIIDDIRCTGAFSDNFDNLTESTIGSGSEAHK